MKYRVIIQPRAERDLRAASSWIHEQSKSWAKAARWLDRMRRRIATLETNPRRCPVDPDSAVYGHEVRVLLFGRRPGVYRIHFAILDGDVHVLTVRHSARQTLIEQFEQTDPSDPNAD